MLICENFANIPFVSTPLQCNYVVLTLSSVAKENEEVIFS